MSHYVTAHAAPMPGSFATACATVTNHLYDTVVAKNQDYGDNLLPRGIFGIMVRLEDKMARLDNLIRTGRACVPETLEDTLRDIAGYALVALTHLRIGDITIQGTRGPSCTDPTTGKETLSTTLPCDVEWDWRT